MEAAGAEERGMSLLLLPEQPAKYSSYHSVSLNNSHGCCGQCVWLTRSSYKHMPVGTDGEFFSNLILMENIDLSKLVTGTLCCSGNGHTNFSIQTLICCRIISITMVGFSPKRPWFCSELKLFFSLFII